jgi:hypothetical protein
MNPIQSLRLVLMDGIRRYHAKHGRADLSVRACDSSTPCADAHLAEEDGRVMSGISTSPVISRIPPLP